MVKNNNSDKQNKRDDKKDKKIKKDDKKEKYEVLEYESFDDMNINDDILRGLYAYGFEKPSAIQKKAIVPMIDKKEIIAQAQSGTGKTGTFTIGTLQSIDPKLKTVQAIIISPTRELAQQIELVVMSIGSYIKNLKTALCVGGIDTNKNINALKSGAQIVVGTPGRILHLIKSDYIDRRDLYDNLKLLVFDEADELLSNNFMEQSEELISYISKDTRICLFSATLSENVLDLIHRYIIPDPVSVLVKKEELTLEGIRQFYIDVTREQWKVDTLCDIYNELIVAQTIIYVNTRRRGEWLQKEMRDKDFPATLISSDMPFIERMKVMKSFRKGEFRVLISTDLLSRGIDIQQVSIVINYDLPKQTASYLHRIGRSGRFGRKGVAINLITNTDYDYKKMREIETYYSTQIEEMPMNISDFI